MTEQMEVMPTVEIVDIRDMSVLDQERIMFQAMTTNVAVEAKRTIATVKDLKSCDEAVAWCADRKEHLKQIDAGFTTRVKKVLYQKWKLFNDQLSGYVKPTEDAIELVMAAVTRKRAEIHEQIRKREEAKNQKLEEKAVDKRAQEVQLLIDKDKLHVAKVVAQKPLAHTPISLPMPKIKGAVWKKKFVVQIEDLGAVLGYIARNPKYHRMVDRERLVSALEMMARDLDGNMAEFKGIKCFQTENSAIIGGPKNG